MCVSGGQEALLDVLKRHVEWVPLAAAIFQPTIGDLPTLLSAVLSDSKAVNKSAEAVTMGPASSTDNPSSQHATQGDQRSVCHH